MNALGFVSCQEGRRADTLRWFATTLELDRSPAAAWLDFGGARDASRDRDPTKVARKNVSRVDAERAGRGAGPGGDGLVRVAGDRAIAPSPGQRRRTGTSRDRPVARTSARRAVASLALALCIASIPASVVAKTLRWAARGDVLTMDPDTTDEGVSANFAALIHDALVERDRSMAIVPRLATSWTMLDDRTWRFALRHGVRFHDGSPFTAADVVFSIERAQDPRSAYAQYARALGKPVRIDDFTVELRLQEPNPLLLEHLNAISIMSRAWCVAHRAEKPIDLKSTDENYAARHANGTGPYRLVARDPGVRTVLARNPDWWGTPEGNVTDVVYTPIASDATRVAALLSGAIDLVQDPPPQDLRRFAGDDALRVFSGPENRIIFVGMDQHRDALPGSDVVGRNPFKDARVREAIDKAIDVDALSSKIMRGQSTPTGCLTTSAAGCPDPALEKRPPVDLVGAKRLLTEAGYPHGFSVTMDCPNDRYINDRDLCIAIAAMLARVDVRVRVDAIPKALFFPKLSRLDTSFYLHGWGGSITDPQDTLDAILHSSDPASAKGTINYARYRDDALDRTIDEAAITADPAKRKPLLVAAIDRAARDHRFIPLHRQMLAWVARKNVVPVLLPSNLVRVEWVRID